MERSLTDGPVLRTLLRLTWPLMLVNVFQALSNMADMLIVGRLIGPEAMSAVATGGQLTFFLTTLSIGIAAGGQILISQQKGAGKQGDLGKTAVALVFLSLLAGVVIALAGFVCSGPLLRLLKTPEGAYDQALGYTRISSAGMIFLFGLNGIVGIYRGLGDTKKPLIFFSAAAVVHVGLGLLFVGVFKMTAAGTALGTVISQAVSLLIAWLFFRRTARALDMRFSFHRFWTRSWEMIKIGLPFGAQMAVLNVSNLFIIAQINAFGVDASAALGAGVRITNLLSFPMLAVGNGATTMIGQSMGAKNTGRVKEIVYRAVFTMLALAALSVALCQWIPRQMIGFFQKSQEVRDIGALYLRVVSWCFLGHALRSGYNAAALGVGFSLYSLFSSSVEAVAGRIALTWILGGLMGMNGIFLAQAISPYISAGVSAIYYYSGRWRRVRLPSS